MNDEQPLWPTLLTQVEEHSGVFRVKIGTLRRMANSRRMGPTVADEIHNRLETLGLVHIPEDLNQGQDTEVMLLKMGTDAAEVVRSVMGILSGNSSRVSDRAESLLGRVNDSCDPDETVARAALRETAEGLLDHVTQLMSMTQKTEQEEEREGVLRPNL